MHGLLDAVGFVLEQIGEPADSRRLAALLHEKKAWRFDIEATEGMVQFRVQASIKRFGSRSQFIEVSEGVFGLRKWMSQKDFSERRAA
jgi:hypothetical protein